MARNYFIGKDQAWLEAKLAIAYEAQATGQRYTRTESAGNVGQKESVLRVDTVIERLLYSLYLLDPDTYPLEDITRVNRTKAVAYSSIPYYNA